MSDILHIIAANKRIEVEDLKLEMPQGRLERDLPPTSKGAFRSALTGDGVRIIAELKKGSPSRGIIAPDFDVAQLAGKYRDGGAAALSVLTDRRYFYGRWENIGLAAQAADLPILCKEFIVDPYQIYYARYMGAQAVLLIVRLHSPRSLADLLGVCADLDLDGLVETHNRAEVEIALEAGAEIIGVNNRDLGDFTVRLETAEKLGEIIPAGVTRVAESGILTRADVERLQRSGYNCFLIGEALVRAEDPAVLIGELRGGQGA